MTKKEEKHEKTWHNHSMHMVKVGDRVKAEGIHVFTVAGIRLNPDDAISIRLLDIDGIIRLQAEPGYMVEVERG